MNETIFKQIDTDKIDTAQFPLQCVGCLVLSWDGMLVLQLRDSFAPTCPNQIATFGGGIEAGETPDQALVRELNEELGAEVKLEEIVHIGAVAATVDDREILVYMYFWHDKNNTITGCYEGSARYVNDPVYLEKQHKVSNSVHWLVDECKKRNLV